MARVLGVQPDSRELEDVRNCALLSPMSAGSGDIETVTVHQVTRSVLKDLFLQDISTSAGKTNVAPYINPTSCCHTLHKLIQVALYTHTDFHEQRC